MLCNIIVDGNYLLNKLVFTLHKNNLLFGALEDSLENAVLNYKKIYPFKKFYLVSDSNVKSWRSKYKKVYKKNRTKNVDIDWNFVYETYNNFKDKTPGIEVCEADHIEGDDWISYIIEKENKSGVSNFVVSNDYDIKQLIDYKIDPLYINMMSNEMYKSGKFFLPENYQIFIDQVKKLPNNDLFNMNYNKEFIQMIESLSNKYEVKLVNKLKELIVKLICGDKSDNIKSVFEKKTKNGSMRGIGEKGAQNLYESYLSEFGEIKLNDSDLYENIADLICEKKKVSKTNIDIIVEKLRLNSKLIDLRISKLPKPVVRLMEKKYIENGI